MRWSPLGTSRTNVVRRPGTGSHTTTNAEGAVSLKLDSRKEIPAIPAGLSERVAAVVFACLLGATRSEEHTSELQSLMRISYAVFCLQKKKDKQKEHLTIVKHNSN